MTDTLGEIRNLIMPGIMALAGQRRGVEYEMWMDNECDALMFQFSDRQPDILLTQNELNCGFDPKLMSDRLNQIMAYHAEMDRRIGDAAIASA